MRVTIHYRVAYHYERAVSFSPHIFRLFPRVDRFLGVDSASFTTNEDADVQYRRDLFDNDIANCFYPERELDLKADLRLELDVREKNAFHFMLETHALDFPFRYTPRELKVLAPCMIPQSAGVPAEISFWHPEPGPTVPALVSLNEAIHKNIDYERREEGTAREPAETLALGRGACRDLSVLLAEMLRSNGVAARLASGYLCEFGGGEKRAGGSLHAWVEAYLPGAGWVGIDPTNGTFCNHNHITAAVGLVPDDISPVLGNYYDENRVPSTMETALELTGAEA